MPVCKPGSDQLRRAGADATGAVTDAIRPAPLEYRRVSAPEALDEEERGHVDVRYDYSGKVALITGAASGMGRVSAIAFARTGAAVAVSDVDVAGGEAVVREIEALGGTARFFEMDVSDADSVDRGVASIVDTFGGLDFAHNNAGIEGRHGKILTQTAEDWAKLVAVDLSSILYCMQAEIRVMQTRGGGSIVNTASAAGLIGGYAFAPYGAVKHGVVGFTKHTAQEMAELGVRINAVCPGPIDTPFLDDLPPAALDRLIQGTPIGRLGQPEEVAQAVLWLCSEGASFVIGVALPVDGGTVIGGMATRSDDLGH
jgi:NAD(P)-dependent dehydrogenase (short-subunit alcohol dehydrogenase family)